ncbi:L,D-transpeptidase family protein [Methylocystis sp. L43]|jgi:L,D-peptidoglycan transpeptidase YkuD (ErfK/YbiS/YcfS/YnhG family)|uniref:L,D-transpeptidase family protein n=1 Tax=unclassified Methylocystis TaxID=2625913 RepID=UPI0018C310A8|nr:MULTISPECIES: L,D-transpeptidase family protein [unclassified Methylocystis]MBG0796383.1 L,D-transpeptidase family protein [Methylocystis sp. L43]MBG0804302.1 L,D-transpeptidase family protein [Methylocystis sp. H15]
MHRRTTRTKPAGLALLRVARRIGGRPHEGRLIAGTLILPCALGRSGISRRKREGDGASPAGRWPLLYFYLRAPNPLRLRWRRTRPHDLWCDDPRSFLYNKPLQAPSRLGHEEMWRKDALYDTVGVMGYNLRPRVRGRGSAIFFHIATDDLSPTAGCVALRARDMARLLPRLRRKVALLIE